MIVARFSCSDFKLPEKHFYSCCKQLAKTGREIIAVQALLPGQSPLRVPEAVKSVLVNVDTVLFRKENLWNYGARFATEEKLVFIDSDIVISPPRWIEDTERCLDSCDIMQPFSECVWLGADGSPVQSRRAVAPSLSKGEQIDFGQHHPGFAWAFRREAFNKINGFYELAACGSGDTAFMLALAGREQVSRLTVAPEILSDPTWAEYKERVQGAKLVLGKHPGACAKHFWHGTRGGRLYGYRASIPPRRSDGTLPLLTREDGIVEWDSPAADRASREYLKGRMDDGAVPLLVLLRGVEDSVSCAEEAGLDVRQVDSVISRNLASGDPLLSGIVDADAVYGHEVDSKFADIADQYPDVKFVLDARSPWDVAIDAAKGDMTVDYKQIAKGEIRLLDSILEKFADCPDRLFFLAPEWESQRKAREIALFFRVSTQNLRGGNCAIGGTAAA